LVPTKEPVPAKRITFYMQMAEQSGTVGSFWYFRFNEKLCPDSTEIVCDEIIKK
jgi:hypothetical protein